MAKEQVTEQAAPNFTTVTVLIATLQSSQIDLLTRACVLCQQTNSWCYYHLHVIEMEQNNSL